MTGTIKPLMTYDDIANARDGLVSKGWPRRAATARAIVLVSKAASKELIEFIKARPRP